MAGAGIACPALHTPGAPGRLSPRRLRADRCALQAANTTGDAVRV